MAYKQSCKFENGQRHTTIVNCHFAKKLICIIHQLMFSSKILRKLEIIIKKKVVAAREKKSLHRETVKAAVNSNIITQR